MMARYLPEFPVGNGKVENLNMVPIVANLKPAKARLPSTQEIVNNAVARALSGNDDELDDELDDFDMDDEFAYEYDEEDDNDGIFLDDTSYKSNKQFYAKPEPDKNVTAPEDKAVTSVLNETAQEAVSVSAPTEPSDS